MDQIEAHPLIRQNRVMVVPGVYDVLSAKIAERAGFPAVVLTGYGVSAFGAGCFYGYLFSNLWRV